MLENFGRGALNVLDSQSCDVCSLQSVFVKVKPQYMRLHCVSLVATVLLSTCMHSGVIALQNQCNCTDLERRLLQGFN